MRIFTPEALRCDLAVLSPQRPFNLRRKFIISMYGIEDVRIQAFSERSPGSPTAV
jgi:hypothetical protein